MKHQNQHKEESSAHAFAEAQELNQEETEGALKLATTVERFDHGLMVLEEDTTELVKRDLDRHKVSDANQLEELDKLAQSFEGKGDADGIGGEGAIEEV